MNMVRSVMPGEFGAHFDFACEYLATWLLEKMDSGELSVARPFRRGITFRDSCHGRVLGG